MCIFVRPGCCLVYLTDIDLMLKRSSMHQNQYKIGLVLLTLNNRFLVLLTLSDRFLKFPQHDANLMWILQVQVCFGKCLCAVEGSKHLFCDVSDGIPCSSTSYTFSLRHQHNLQCSCTTYPCLGVEIQTWPIDCCILHATCYMLYSTYLLWVFYFMIYRYQTFL
jgi:hypothetical protein